MQVYRNGIWKGPIYTHYYMIAVTAAQHLLQSPEQEQTFLLRGAHHSTPKRQRFHEFLQKDIYKVIFYYLYI